MVRYSIVVPQKAIQDNVVKYNIRCRIERIIISNQKT